jgi:hypothetical protein
MTSTEKYVSEKELNEKAVAPRVTLEQLEANIRDETYFTAADAAGIHSAPRGPLDLLTFCVLTLQNGFTVTGQSACASPENYDENIGRRVARGDAIRQVWALMGYELRSKLHRLSQVSAGDDRLGEALTRLTAYGLGEHEMLRMSDVDNILNHFMHTDHQEEGGVTFAREVIDNATNVDLVERNELGAAHPDDLTEPTITEESVR